MVRSRFLDVVDERVVVFDGAFGTYMQQLDLTADDFGGPRSRAATRSSCLTRPDVIAGCTTPSSRSASTSSRRPPSAASPRCSPSTTSPTRPTSSTSPRPASPARVADGSARTAAPLRRRLDRPGHEAAQPRPHPLRRPARRLRGAGRRAARGRRRPAPRRDVHSTCSRLKAAMIACRRAMAAAGRAVPLQVQVTMETTGRMLVGTEIGAALVSPLAAMRRRRPRHQLRHRPGRDAGAPALPQPALPAADQRAAQRRPAVGRRRQDALRPHAGELAEYHARLRHRARRVGRRRLLRHDARAPPRSSRPWRPHAGAPRRRARAERDVDLPPGADRAGPQRS